MAKKAPSRGPKNFATAARQHGQVVGSKTIEGTAIVSRIASVLKLSPPIDPKQNLNKIPQGGLTNWDLGLGLMTYPPFFRDGLILNKADVMKATTVGNLGDLVFAWYLADGWTVV